MWRSLTCPIPKRHWVAGVKSRSLYIFDTSISTFGHATAESRLSQDLDRRFKVLHVSRLLCRSNLLVSGPRLLWSSLGVMVADFPTISHMPGGERMGYFGDRLIYSSCWNPSAATQHARVCRVVRASGRPEVSLLHLSPGLQSCDCVMITQLCYTSHSDEFDTLTR